MLTPLLHNVCQFMRQKFPTGRCVGSIFSGAEDDVMSNGVGPGIKLSSRFRSRAVRMNSHFPKAAPVTRLEKGANRTRQRISTGAEMIDPLLRPGRPVRCGTRLCS